MYRIIGADGKEYGPITADQVRQWAVEGRANALTKIRLEGSTEWKTLSDFPELMAAPPPPSAGAAPPSFPAPGLTPGSSMAQNEVNGPGIGLIVTAILGLVAQLMSLGYRIFFSAMLMQQQSNAPAWANMMAGSAGVIASIVGILVSGVLLFGGIKMRKLENYGLAMTASILAMIPCISPCCIVGLPIGIWCLVVLSKPEVKNSFH